jgi:hypothetical protein
LPVGDGLRDQVGDFGVEGVADALHLDLEVFADDCVVGAYRLVLRTPQHCRESVVEQSDCTVACALRWLKPIQVL